jgi:hypothetical protein
VVANGDTSHTDALVSGYDGVESSDVGMVVNDGVITGSGAKSQAAGVAIDTGVVDNGSLADEAALIRGANGVSVQTSGTVSNYGTIKGSTYGGVVFRGTGSLSNGSSSDTTALIRGVLRGRRRGDGGQFRHHRREHRQGRLRRIDRPRRLSPQRDGRSGLRQ